MLAAMKPMMAQLHREPRYTVRQATLVFFELDCMLGIELDVRTKGCLHHSRLGLG